MYHRYKPYPCPYHCNRPTYHRGNRYHPDMYNYPNNIYDGYNRYPDPYQVERPMCYPDPRRPLSKVRDYGPEPFVVNIEEATKQNKTYRTALWTGCYLQLTLMSIDVGDDIGLELHEDHDQFIRIEEGQGIVKMGDRKDQLNFQRKVYDDYAIFIPAGKWHNLINTGNRPLKLYSIYAPPEHPRGTVHVTKEDAK
ncbi:cupin domain-containing protein [Heliorestis convoluta]|uniref:Cupin domain-containing protein n=1 Tax=Heliorestis convoluta TaxID=356322 RepID=A0A5Q2N269_9FIRM|nr:cupin domain-containing protein [Heliorestis convoluta]QGG46440.1 cupin domain-containing protein [Heliorestis convoluta]